jgi:alkanesulfonate monooxygenase SsuD/methylene tetrahydromethanopterin reductase-like flavin-dependent oxidoreductase (luciferase family)
MDIGLFMVPFRLPENDFKTGMEFDMQVVRWAEEYGIDEMWFGEHTTIRWEQIPAPELYIAVASQMTERLRLCTGAHLIPNHNPIALAHRLMMLDHMTEGRLIVGVGAGAYPGDQRIHGSFEAHEMMVEAIDIMQRIWTADGTAFRYDGKYWNVDYPEYDEFLMGPHWKPYQQPTPPIAMAGLSPASNTLRQAGAQNFIPMSFNVAPHYLAGHWYRYVQGAEAAGFKPDRNRWRVTHNIFLADTDEEAYELAVNGAMGRTYRDWMLPSYKAGGLLPVMAPELDPDDVTVEWLAQNRWLVGTPDTVLERLQKDIDISGGFGTLIPMTFEYTEHPEEYRRHLELLGTEVAPRLKELKFDTEPLSELEEPQEVAPIALGPKS